MRLEDEAVEVEETLLLEEAEAVDEVVHESEVIASQSTQEMSSLSLSVSVDQQAQSMEMEVLDDSLLSLDPLSMELSVLYTSQVASDDQQAQQSMEVPDDSRDGIQQVEQDEPE